MNRQAKINCIYAEQYIKRGIFMKIRTIILTIFMIACLTVPTFASESIDNGIRQELSANDSQEYIPKSEKTSVSSGKFKLKSKMESTHRVVLKWEKVAGASGYTVYKSSKKNSGFKAYKKVGKNKLLINNVKPGRKSFYIVKAKNKTGSVKISNTLKVKTPKVLKQTSKGFRQTNAYKVIKAARKKLGCAYVSGAAGPNKFDCSGYTYYIYNKVKSVKRIKTKRFARSSAQGNYNTLKKYNIGKKIKKAQPGDIMLFSHSGGKSGIYHAALYYGNGKIIHASSPGTGVTISRIAHRKVAAIIRLPKM